MFGADSGRYATKPVNIYFVSHPHVAENVERHTVERKEVFTFLAS